MKNQLTKILFIVGIAVVVQACKKESVNSLGNNNNQTEKPQSVQLPNDPTRDRAKEIDMTDLAGASTPYNYPLEAHQLMISPGMIEVEEDTTKPKIRRGIVVTIGNDVSPVYEQGVTIRYLYTGATAVYFSGTLYNVISDDMIVSVVE